MADELAAGELTVGEKLTNTLARVRGIANGAIGTGHLLYSLAHDKEIRALLDSFDITPVVVLAVLKTTGRPHLEPGTGPLWDPDAVPGPGRFDGLTHVRDTDGHVLPLSDAAARALRDAGDSRTTVLAAILGDPGSEAAAVIRDSGADPDEIRQAVASNSPSRRPDRLPPELRPARDALLGRVKYRGRGLRDKLLFSMFASGINHGDRPVLWARLEADERAREQRRATRTDDVLRAVLVTHAVAAAYPHMAAGAKDLYGGAEAVLGRGVDHLVRLDDDQPDAVPVEKILRPGPDWTEDTRVLLERLTAHPGNRATRLLVS